MPNGRCRLHGGKSPGAPRGNNRAQKTGAWTPEAKAADRKRKAEARAVEAEVKSAIATAEKVATAPKPRGRPPALNADGTRVNPPITPERAEYLRERARRKRAEQKAPAHGTP